MSSQHGNVKKTGPPKHKNRSAFKNTMHDHSKKTLQLVAMNVTGCCARCKEIIDWKIKYKKYKPLGQPKKCVRCLEKKVTRAYYVVCESCAKRDGICAKCVENKQIIQEPELSPADQAAMQSQVDQEVRFMSERQRRAFKRSGDGLRPSDGTHACSDLDSDEDDKDGEADDEAEDDKDDRT